MKAKLFSTGTFTLVFRYIGVKRTFKTILSWSHATTAYEKDQKLYHREEKRACCS